MTRWIGLAIAAAVVIAVPAFASGQPERAPGSIVAVDFGFQNPADGSPLVTIHPGETVTFSYPDGSSFHNVQFTKEQPSSCTLTAGGSGPVPPLPASADRRGWSGTCTFNAEGTYEFVCGAHPRHDRRRPRAAGGRDADTDAQRDRRPPRRARQPPRAQTATATATADGDTAGRRQRPPHRSRRRHRPATGPRRSPRPRAGSRSPAPSAARRSRAHSRRSRRVAPARRGPGQAQARREHDAIGQRRPARRSRSSSTAERNGRFSAAGSSP